MSGQVRFDRETRERAVRLFREEVGLGGSATAARKKVAGLLGLNQWTLRSWVDAADGVGAKSAVPGSEDLGAEVVRLRRENKQLRTANEILRTAAAFFAQAEVDRKLR